MTGVLPGLDPGLLLPVQATMAGPLAAAGDSSRFDRLLQRATVRALDGSVPAEQEMAERSRQEQGLREASQGLEALLVNQMFSAMRKTVPKNELFDGGMGEDIFRGMLDQEYATALSKTGSLGLADIIYNQMHDYIA